MARVRVVETRFARGATVAAPADRASMQRPNASRGQSRRRHRPAPSALAFLWLAFAAAIALAWPRCGRAESLSNVIPNLFGGSLGTTISQNGVSRALQEPELARRFRNLPAALAAARSQAPVPSASGAFRFAWDPELDTFVRSEQSLGPILAERAATLGRGVLTVGFSYSYSNFDTLEGDSLADLHFQQPALSKEFLADLPAGDQMAFGDDILETRLNMSFRLNLFYVSAAYGIGDNIDVSLAIAINEIHMRGRAEALILDPLGNGSTVFGADQPGVVRNGTGPICSRAFRCAVDQFDKSASGTGDIYLRGKWNFANTRWVDLATSAVLTIPTGNGDDLLGFNDPTFTPWLIASKTFGPISPHFNLGYAFRSGKDVSQLQWILGADARATNWLTVGADFLGYHDDKRDRSNDDVIQSAIGLKLNPFGQFVIGAGLQFPLNRDGLRADIVYSGQAEYTF